MAPTEKFPARPGISQTQILFAGFVLLEALFWRLRRFGNLEVFVVETIAIGLAAGVIYFIDRALSTFDAHLRDAYRTGMADVSRDTLAARAYALERSLPLSLGRARAIGGRESVSRHAERRAASRPA